MSNQAYEKLHKLVAYLIRHGILSKAKMSEVIGVSLIDFLDEFDKEEYYDKPLATRQGPD